MRALLLMCLLMMGPANTVQEQGTGIHAPLIEANSLSGHVDDMSGGPIGQARADLLDCSTMQLTKRSLADADGEFLLTKGWDSDEYCLRFSQDGFKTVELRVRLEESAGNIQVKLPSDGNQGPKQEPTNTGDRIRK